MAVSDQLPHDEELRSLYRRLPADEPRAEIDEAILSAARELADATARKSSDRHEGHRRRFMAPGRFVLPLAAAAASVILTVTLTRLTPEQPAVAPSELRESSDSEVAYGTASPEVQEGGELAAQPLEDTAPGGERNTESPRSESAEAAARARVEWRDSEAGKSTAANSAMRAESAREAPADASKKKAETAAEGIARLEDRRLAEQKKAGNQRVAPAAPPPPPSAGAGAAAPAEPIAEEKLDSLESLGYLDGGTAPARPARPAAPADAARSNAAPTDAPSSDAAPPDAAPASPPVAAMGSRDDTESYKAGEDHAAAKGEAYAEQARARHSRRTKADWPFGLAPGLDAAQACRSLQRAMGVPCLYVDGVAVVRPETAMVIDRGEFKDRKVTRVTLFAPGRRLEKIALQVEGFTTEQILVAPPSP
jgi:hypothetical protein